MPSCTLCCEAPRFESWPRRLLCISCGRLCQQSEPDVRGCKVRAIWYFLAELGAAVRAGVGPEHPHAGNGHRCSVCEQGAGGGGSVSVPVLHGRHGLGQHRSSEVA